MKLLLSCEHGGNTVPPEFVQKLSIPNEVLESHRGLDIGALQLTHTLAHTLKPDFVLINPITRLLIDFNRSRHHRHLYSSYSEGLEKELKLNLLYGYYLPYREKIFERISQWQAKGESVVHLSIHSFTPCLNGQVRMTDVGLLYDPSRMHEKHFCQCLKAFLKDKHLKTRMNYPYLGTSDGLTKTLRARFVENYIGLEIETNQRLWELSFDSKKYQQQIAKALEEALVKAAFK